MISRIVRFFSGFDYWNGILLMLSVVIPILVFYSLGMISTGVTVAFGAFLASPGAIPGSKRHLFYGILASIILSVITYICINLAHANAFIMTVAILFFVFISSYISVYGFRASLVSFSALLTITVSMAHIVTGKEIFISAFYLMIGGFWFMLVTYINYRLRPGHHGELLISECMRLTADYLSIRTELLQKKSRNKKVKELLDLQTQIIEKHEELRTLLLSRRSRSGTSKFLEQQFLIFIELVDILELAIANPVNYETVDSEFSSDHEVIVKFGMLIKGLSERLRQLASEFRNEKSETHEEIDLDQLVYDVNHAISNFRESIDLKKSGKSLVMLRNLFDYEEKQVQKIKNIERLSQDPESYSSKSALRASSGKFLTRQKYDLKTLKANFTQKSPIFKHSLRLTVTIFAGYLIGSFFSIQNTYWILLTIIVIMRPSYGLTKERSKQRVAGTLIGGAIAIGIVLLTQNKMIYGAIALISMVFAFSSLQLNYKTAAVFITLLIVFIYTLLHPNALEVIQYRIIDTLIGAGLAVIANFTLWPFWEQYNIDRFISASIDANKKYLKEVSSYYNEKQGIKDSYKLSRKEAFIAIGNLNAAFQRMAQQPRNKQLNFRDMYEAATIQHTFLSSTAALGTYIQLHPTSRATEDFNVYIEGILYQLDKCNAALNGAELAPFSNTHRLQEARSNLKSAYGILYEKRKTEIESTEGKVSRETRLRFQEAQLMAEQLEYLHSLSGSLYNSIVRYKEKTSEALMNSEVTTSVK